MIIRRICWLLVLVGFGAAVVSGANRWRIERANRTVEIVLDYGELRTLAAATNQPIPSVLNQFRAVGATAVALPEETINSLEDAKRLKVITADRGGTTLLPLDVSVERIRQSFIHKRNWKATASNSPQGMVLNVDEPYGIARSVGIGLDPDIVVTIQSANMGVIGRVANWQGIQPPGIQWTLQQLKDQQVPTIIFTGEEVLGYKGYVVSDKEKAENESTEASLRALKINYGTVEFGKQKGDPQLSIAAQDRVIRVHTILGAEMATAEIPGNIQRFLLAARERNIRLLFVRLFESEKDTLPSNLDYVDKIAKGLKRAGMEVGRAKPFAPLGVPHLLRGLMGVGLAAAWLLLLDSITMLFSGGANHAVSTTAILGAIVLIALPLSPGTLGVKLAALASACLFPALAMAHTDYLRPGKRAGRAQSLWSIALSRLALMTAITTLGIATIIGMLADRIFLIKADLFLGIKGAQLVPVVIIALLYALPLRATTRENWSRTLQSARNRLVRLGGEPLLYWQIAAAVLALAVVVLLIARSGNDPGVGVSSLELKFRALLDRFLYARPRTKEFLIGHPAMVIALLLAVRGRRNWALPFFLIGAIGQVSLLNTFCHLHTPILVSLARAGIGLGLGVLIAVPVYALLDRSIFRNLAHPPLFQGAEDAISQEPTRKPPLEGYGN